MDYVNYIREKVGHNAINLTGVNVLIINEENEILLQKRGTFPFKWGLIGGITELGEALEETAIRETKEETGLDIEDLRLLGTVSGKDCYIKFPHGDEAYFINVGYVTRKYHGQIRCDGVETIELKFFSVDKLPKNIPSSHLEFINKFFNI
jgi:ADP-ribose pyrophosphatase YjhB (NUDIX family)